MADADVNLQIIATLVDNASAQLQQISNQLNGGSGGSGGVTASLQSVRAAASQVAIGFGLMSAAILGPMALLVNAASGQQVATEELNNALTAMKEAGDAAVSTDSTLTDQKKRLSDQIAANDSAITKLTQRYDTGKISLADYTAGVDKLNQSSSTLQTKIDDINQKLSNSQLNVAQVSQQFQNLAIQNTNLGFTVTDSENAFTSLLKITGSVKGSMDLMGLSMDVARSYNMPLNDAATALGKIYEGNTRGLLQFGISIKDNLTPMQALDEIQQKVGSSGQSAAEYAKTFAGQMDVAQANANLLQVQLGNGLLPVLTTLLKDLDPIIQDIVKWTQAHPQLTQDLIIGAAAVGVLAAAIAAIAAIVVSATVVIGALSTVLEVLGIALLAATGPVGLIVIAIGAIAFAGYMLWQNLKGYWPQIIKDVQDFVNDFLKFIKPVTDFIGGIGSAIGGAIKGLGGNGLIGNLGPVTSVKDAIITPSGIVQTDPADYIFATKNPGSLAGGSGGITVNINGGMFSGDANMVRQFANQIARQINQNLKLRTF